MDLMQKLRDVIRQLRDPDKGCPWDKEQTHLSLTPYVIEEAYEVVEAIESRDDDTLVDELGDLLLQVVLHARIAEERGAFSMDDVIRTVSAKLIRRHPHVFADTRADNVKEVWKNWEMIKKQEKEDNADRQPQSILDSVPLSMPGLIRAEKVQKKVGRLGFDWPDPEDTFEKLSEEVEEFKKAQDHQQQEEEIGDLLFTMVNIARKYDIHAEEALRRSTDKFVKRFKIVEEKINEQQKNIEDYSLEELEKFWQQAKSGEQSA